MSSDRNDIAQALWYIAPGRAELREEVLLPPPTGSVCVRALHGALSRGTESLIFSGQVPKSEFDRMRAPFMAGAFPFPVKYGYSVVGQIETGPSELRGRAVFALHPHQTRFIIPDSAAVPLPESLPPTRAVLAANMETALNAMWDASPKRGDRIAIVGVGVVGRSLSSVKRARYAADDSTGVMMAARTEHEWCATREVCDRGGGATIPCQRRTREGQRRRTQMADGFVLPLRPGNAGGGKEP